MKEDTAHHVLTLPLAVNAREARVIDQRLVVLGKLRNAVLSTLVKRVNATRQDKRYHECVVMPSGKQRSEGFMALRVEYGLRPFDATSVATTTLQKSKWMRAHVSSGSAQAAALQVYVSVNEWLLGKRGKPRFKPSDACDVMWGASASSPARYDVETNELVIGVGQGKGNKEKTLRLSTTKTTSQVTRLVNEGVVRSSAVKRELVRGRTRYFALVRVQGEPYRSTAYADTVADGSVVGLDAGPSKLAVVDYNGSYALNRAPLELLNARKVEQARIRRTQRALDRSRRATNPECFDERGRWVKGKKAVVKSNAFERKQRKLASEQRAARVNRREDETRLAKRIMQSGNIIAVEDVSYRGWQASFYGKRMGFTAPGSLMARVKREALTMNGRVVNLPLSLALSQHCVCGARAKKDLGERVHNCSSCGLVADRDALPAWFAKMIVTAGLESSCGKTTLGPLLGKVTAAAEYEPNDPSHVRELSGRLTPSVEGSTKLALAGSSVKVSPLRGNTHEDSVFVSTPRVNETRRLTPEH